MKVYRTAAITAVWRNMAGIDSHSIKYVNFPMRFFAYVLGLLDKNSVVTIAKRTELIDSIIAEIKPRCIVEIGAGFSSRAKRFGNIRFYELDLPYFRKFKNETIPFEIGKDEFGIKIKEALFIAEGVSMYLQEEQVLKLLNQIRNYRGRILIDFFSKSHSTKQKSLREKLYKLLFKLILQKNHLFDYRIRNVQDGISLLRKIGYKDVKYYNHDVQKTLDVLFYAKL